MKALQYKHQYDTYDVGWATRNAWESGFTTAKFEQELAAFELLEPDIEVSINGFEVKINNPERSVLYNFLKTFGGDWEKTVNDWDKTKMDYTQKRDLFTLQVIAVTPPPACQIVEEDVVIPAQPERIEKRKVIKCPEPLPVETETETTPQENVIVEVAI